MERKIQNFEFMGKNFEFMEKNFERMILNNTLYYRINMFSIHNNIIMMLCYDGHYYFLYFIDLQEKLVFSYHLFSKILDGKMYDRLILSGPINYHYWFRKYASEKFRIICCSFLQNISYQRILDLSKQLSSFRDYTFFYHLYMQLFKYTSGLMDSLKIITYLNNEII